ncbi:hypothetical protein J2Z57_003179 [Formosa algae]|uniref:Uncharacterized protein n=1 Tax=Formosa algae TaxID=225843 RepID=A0A9X1CA32_9FLAO|nr:hypothetical protein [Formosa algae]MDQ0336725.1 hypothetical protein [Formosa algae]
MQNEEQRSEASHQKKLNHETYCHAEQGTKRSISSLKPQS